MKIWPMFVTAVAFNLSNADRVEACSCLPPDRAPSIEQEFKKASSIFIGEVIQIDAVNLDVQPTVLSVSFRVLESFKRGDNVREESALVFTSSSAGYCNYPFKVGNQYVVWTSADWLLHDVVGLCSRTELRNTERALNDLEWLRGLPICENSNGPMCRSPEE